MPGTQVDAGRFPFGVFLPKRNYGFEKRQKELTKQRQKEEKKQRKLERTKEPAVESPGEEPGSEGSTIQE
jgi:hypothetical protein